MTEQEKAKKLQEVFADEAFAEKIFALETAEEVQTALKEKGLELSAQEIGDIRDALVNQTESGEELDPEQLKKAAGGGYSWYFPGSLLGMAKDRVTREFMRI